ncbi:MAG: hypothetical protein HC838_05060 [Spirulinaceae cyanobacterium RM2_2_10]|nr:hypothetical protein [Spirulinaceae cyanobacterium SM2_1_0]NJO19545.1 hypothetical protein [Spirulinaceae cyanobacterium RM2_2_10]
MIWESIRVLDLLFLAAIALLIAVSGGVLYLSTVEWRDRRRRDRDQRATK